MHSKKKIHVLLKNTEITENASKGAIQTLGNDDLKAFSRYLSP